jgi:hypothetical protein
MTRTLVRVAGGLLALLVFVAWPVAGMGPARAVSCHSRGVEVDLAGSGDVAVVSGRSAATCQTPPSSRDAQTPYSTDELLCSPDQAGATAGRCSATPCRGTGLFFALRTLHEPNGRERPAGFACMELGRARVGPGITAAQVLEAVRAVKLPGGTVRVTPSVRGLTNLAAYFRLDGVAPRTVDLPLGGSRIHAEFQVTEARWSFGDGSARTKTATGLPGALGEAHAYPHGGRFEIRVEVAWSAAAFLDGRRVGRVDDLVSHALISYPVAEIRGVLSG